MGKKLAIKGHPTRGKEVIELLEMMGGDKIYSHWNGDQENMRYFINGQGNIDNGCLMANRIYCEDFTLEEFLEKYPFKVGDKVQVLKSGKVFTIGNMIWDDEDCDIYYYNAVDIEYYNAEELKLYKETDTVKPVTNKSERTHEDVIFDSIIWHLRNSVNNGKQNLSGGECEDYFREVVKKNNENKMKNVLAELLEHIKNTSKEELEKEFNELDEWSNVGPTVEEFMTFCECVNKKPFYPTTYEECCQHLGCDDKISTKKLVLFSQLINARNAYWKIAGEQMGLDNPWKPDWNDGDNKFVIQYLNNEVGFWLSRGLNYILAFPTIELRDAFYENFKDLIEQCKELL